MMNMYKTVGWIGVAFIVLAFLGEPEPTQYALEGMGFLYVLLYGYKKVTNETILWILSIGFILVYIFVNPSILDVALWGAVLFGLLMKK